MPKKIAVVGSRSRDSQEDYNLVVTAFDALYEPGDSLVSGGCPRGGDRFAEVIAKERSIPIIIFYADWNKHGKAAGFIRNTDVAEECDILIACLDPANGRGTQDTIRKAKALGKEVVVV